MRRRSVRLSQPSSRHASAALLALLTLAAVRTASAQPPSPEARGPAPEAAASPEGCVPALHAALGLGAPGAELRRVAQLAGAAPLQPELVRRTSDERVLRLCAEGEAPAHVRADAGPLRPELRLLPVASRTYLNGAYPEDRNTGALWAGRGVSTALTAGLEARWRFFTLSLEPLLAYQQNRAFLVGGEDPAGRPALEDTSHDRIDLPLRFGSTPFWTAHPGQSSVRAELFNARVGFSTENLWWGPGIRDAILMTNTAAGFPHLFVGTAAPADIYIGWLEAQVLWGRLHESAYFNADAADDRRLFNGLTLTFEPRILPGLYLGIARAYHHRIPPEGLSLGTYFVPLVQSIFKESLADEDNPSGQSNDNQLLSLSARWVFPQVGFEVYGEFARDDHSWHMIDLLMEPEHASAYLLGLQKLTPLGRRWVRLHAELVHLYERPVSPFWRPTPSFYTHYFVRQGHTQRGQMLGSGLGPGGESQFVGVDVLEGSASVGLYVERVQRHQSYYFRELASKYGHDLEMTAGLRGRGAWNQLDVAAELALSRRWNRDFSGVETSPRMDLSLTWWPGRRSAPALPAPALRTPRPASTPPAG